MLQLIRNATSLAGLRERIRDAKRAYRATRVERELRDLRRKIGNMAETGQVELDHFRGRLTDAANGYIQYKDLFVRQIYRFDAVRPDPLIIDCGSNIGMSIVYFKRRYPQARIIGFEPDPAIFAVLEENVAANQLHDVRLVHAALSDDCGTACFRPDGEAGGQLAGNEHAGLMVRVERLSDYLDQPVDFLKLNIEGAELPVLHEVAAAGKLRNVREIVTEYHGWPDAEQRLGDLLNLYKEHGYRYLVHDFDSETCGTSKPPFRWTPTTTWFCLVYALRIEHARQQEGGAANY